MADRPSDRAIAQAFTIESECRDLDDVRASLFVEHVLGRARTLAPAPINPPESDSKLIVPSAECWRSAVLEGCAIKSFRPSAEWFEQRARELAREGK